MRYLVLILALFLAGCAGTLGPGGKPADPGTPLVVLVPIGPFPEAQLSALATYSRDRLGIEAEIGPTIEFSKFLIDFARKQVSAHHFMEIVEGRYKKRVAGTRWIIVGLTAQDIYLPELDWKFAFSLRKMPAYAVISTARMGEGASDDVLIERLKKLFAKNVGILAQGKSDNDDPESALYRNIRGVEDLDKMNKDY